MILSIFSSNISISYPGESKFWSLIETWSLIGTLRLFQDNIFFEKSQIV